MLGAGQEIRSRLIGEKETWAARHIAQISLAPSFSDIGSLVASVPKVNQVDVSSWLQFFVKVWQAFQWNVDTGLGITQPDQSVPATGTPLDVPPRWKSHRSCHPAVGVWFVKRNWLRSVDIVDRLGAPRCRATTHGVDRRRSVPCMAGCGNSAPLRASVYSWWRDCANFQIYDDEANKPDSQPFYSGRKAFSQRRSCCKTA